ncbi:MAG: serine/threonine-protein kinase [Kiritimatiellia bacterium]
MSNPVIAGFELLEKLGEGGAGAVFKARQLSLGRMVAIKVLPSHLADDAQHIERFKKEAQTAAQLKHPGIVQVYEAGQDGRTSFIAMEFVNGYSVGDWIERSGALAPQDVVAVGVNVAKALDYAWQKARLIHLDIKPDNLLIDEDGTVKVADLGLALMLEREPAPGQQEELHCTPNFAPPELIRGTPPPDCRADIYSLGAAMYHMATGQIPFDGQTGNTVLECQLSGHLDDPHKLNPAVPPALSLLLRKMMARDPEMRYPDWAAVTADMERVAAGGLPFAPIPEHVDSTIRYLALPADASQTGLSHKPGENRRVVVRHAELQQHQAATTVTKPGKGPSMAGPLVLLCIIAAGGFGVWKLIDVKRAAAEEQRKQSESLQKLTDAFQAAQKFAADNPEDLGGITQRLDAVARQANAIGGSSLAETCKQQIDSARITHDRRRDQVFYDLRDQATVFVAKREFDKAIAVYKDYRGPFANATRDLRDREVKALQKLMDDTPRNPPPLQPGPLPPAAGLNLDTLFAALPKEAAPLRAAYDTALQGGDAKAAREKLAAGLEMLKRELTKQGRIDEAIQVRDAQARIQESN